MSGIYFEDRSGRMVEKPEGIAIVERKSAYAVIVEDGKILVHTSPSSSLWMLPGGGIESGETPFDGAAREVFEETGYRVDNGDGEPFFECTNNFYSDDTDTYFAATLFFLRVTQVEKIQELPNDTEVSDVLWVPLAIVDESNFRKFQIEAVYKYRELFL